MRKTLGLAILFAVARLTALAQTDVPPKQAIDIPKSDIEKILASDKKGTDNQIRVVDMGKYNLAVGIVHRGPTKPGAPPGGIIHKDSTETYVIVSGGGTLWTGGTIPKGRESGPDSAVTKILNGPSFSGPIVGGTSRKVVPGDVIIIPFGVAHGWTDITDHVDYLSVRPDPDHVLPAGYVNPIIQGQ